MGDSTKTDARLMKSEAALIQLHEATWYAFDLDDTLHEFRKASAAAVKAVLKTIHETSGHTLEELDEEYKRVLSRGTALAFVDGKTSHQYREDRFQQLARVFDIKLNEGQMQILVDLYEEVLTQSLELKPGVLELFQTLKRCGKKIAVITEGPQDAQERTVEALGLTSYIDYLATTNKLRVAKIDGLFSRVLKHLSLRPEEIIITGDSWKRDIVPATQAGIYCIHYSEKGPEYDDSEKWMSIGTFGQLQDIIEKAHHDPEA